MAFQYPAADLFAERYFYHAAKITDTAIAVYEASGLRQFVPQRGLGSIIDNLNFARPKVPASTNGQSTFEK
jgi:hypothetical protein